MFRLVTYSSTVRRIKNRCCSNLCCIHFHKKHLFFYSSDVRMRTWQIWLCLSCRPMMEVGWNVKLPVSVCVQMISHLPSKAGWAGVRPSCAKHLILVWLSEEGLKRWMGFCDADNLQGGWWQRESVLVWRFLLFCWSGLWRKGWLSEMMMMMMMRGAPRVEEEPWAPLPQFLLQIKQVSVSLVLILLHSFTNLLF